MPDEVSNLLTVEEAAMALNIGADSVYKYLAEEGHPRFPNARKPLGNKWAIPREDIDALLGKKPIAPDIQESIAKISAETELARKSKEHLDAVNELEATKLHFPDAATWRKVQDEFVQVQAQYAKDKAQLDADNVELKRGQNELSAKIAETNVEIDKVHDDLIKMRDEAKQRIEANLKDFENGVKGLVESAVRLLTTPVTKAAGYVVYPKCFDCLKADDASRDMTFNIPRLKFGPCADCEQKRSRHLPKVICEICPIQNTIGEASRLLIQALVASGINPKFDDDGSYQPVIPDEKGRILKPSERVKAIMKDYGIEV